MSDVMGIFPHLAAFDQTQLYQRRTEILGSAPGGDMKQLSDEALQELLAIARHLRKKAAPAAASKAAPKRAVAPSLDAL